jgi:hypothetical protein
MLEIQCPFCDETGRMVVAEFQAARAVFRCEACRVTVDLDGGAETVAQLAA